MHAIAATATISTTSTTNIATKAKGIKMKISRNV